MKIIEPILIGDVDDLEVDQLKILNTKKSTMQFLELSQVSLQHRGTVTVEKEHF